MAPARAGHRHTVLLVEDDYVTSEALLELVGSVGIDAVAVENGRPALRLLHDGLRPCLILLDMAMPDMDGFAFRREQLADPAIAHVPVAVVSGGGWAVQADARKLGLAVFLPKPVEFDELLRVLSDHCVAGRSR